MSDTPISSWRTFEGESEVERLRAENAKLREEVTLLQQAANAHYDEAVKLRELLDAKAMEAAGLAGTLHGAEAENARLREIEAAARELHIESVEAGGRVRVKRTRYLKLRNALKETT